MQRGPKPQGAAAKQAKGTYQECRDKPKHLVINAPPPIMPAYLPPEAQQVWHEEIDRVMLAGTCELDSSLFARYCCEEARYRQAIVHGVPTHGNLLSELRRTAETLGIAGVPSRSQRGTPSTGDENVNPFAALPEG